MKVRYRLAGNRVYGERGGYVGSGLRLGLGGCFRVFYREMLGVSVLGTEVIDKYNMDFFFFVSIIWKGGRFRDLES